MQLNHRRKGRGKGVELAASVRLTEAWRVWGNVAYVDAHICRLRFIGGSFSGNTPAERARVVAKCRNVLTALPRFGRWKLA